MAKTLIITGLFIAGLGVLLYLGGKIPWLGNLPGDIHIKTERFQFYFPLGTCLLISGILSLVFYLLRR